MRTRSSAACLALLTLALCLPACGDAAAPSPDSEPAQSSGAVGLKRVGTFAQPVYVTGAPGFPRLLFVVEQAGRIVVLNSGKRLARPFLDLRGQVGFSGGEDGLLSVAFAPDYRRSGRFYVYYTDRKGDIRLDELRRQSATQAEAGSRRAVMRIPHPGFSNHNGGLIKFDGPLLYIGTGDGGSAGDPPNNAQNKNVLLGKLLRIDPRRQAGRPYSVPATNPFVNRAGRDEIYSYGLRNPYRFSFDRRSGKTGLAIADVGQSGAEEINYLPLADAAGANFGWDAFEGLKPFRGENSGTPPPTGTVAPAVAYPHSRGGSCSVIGGTVVRDPALRALLGRYLYADFCEGQLRSVKLSFGGARDDRRLGLPVANPTSFGEDGRGRIYVTSIEGPVYRLVP